MSRQMFCSACERRSYECAANPCDLRRVLDRKLSEPKPTAPKVQAGTITRDEEEAILACDTAQERVVEAGRVHGIESEECMKAVDSFRVLCAAYFPTFRNAIARLQGDA